MAVPLGQETGHLPVAMRDVICKARTSWLKNSEVLDILLNFKRYRFPVGKEAPDCPPGGTLLLFNRKAVRFFRKDGHEWRKKADGKTVRETHEKLKIDNKDMLNCYYAHSEAKDAKDMLQRRCYWLLDGECNIVLVHYLSSHPAARLQTAAAVVAQLRDSGCTYQVRTNEEMSRAGSVPNNLGSDAQHPGKQSLSFTVTTGESLQQLLAERRGTAAAAVDDFAAGMQSPRQAFSAAANPFFRAASTPVSLPSTLQRLAVVPPAEPFQPLERNDSGISLGPLHTAPSFSAGTVQTGSTLDAAALQQRSLTMESRQSSMSGTSDLPFGTEPASRAPSEGLDTDPRSGPLLIKIPVPAHQAKAWGKTAQQGTVTAEPEALESLRRDSEQTEMNFELKPAMSLTRVDSDTLLVAPSLSRATSGMAAKRRSDGSNPAPAKDLSSLHPKLPSSVFSPFYALAFAGNPIRTIAEEAGVSANAPAACQLQPMQMQRRVPEQTDCWAVTAANFERPEPDRFKRRKSFASSTSTTFAQEQPAPPINVGRASPTGHAGTFPSAAGMQSPAAEHMAGDSVATAVAATAAGLVGEQPSLNWPNPPGNMSQEAGSMSQEAACGCITRAPALPLGQGSTVSQIDSLTPLAFRAAILDLQMQADLDWDGHFSLHD